MKKRYPGSTHLNGDLFVGADRGPGKGATATSATPAYANALHVFGAKTGLPVGEEAVGDDADISISRVPKGLGVIALAGPMQDLVTVGSYANAGNNTFTVADVLGGMIRRDCNAGARTDTLPTAAALVAAMKGAAFVGALLEFGIVNITGTAQTHTLAVGTGGTASAGDTLTTTQAQVHFFWIVLTNVTAGAEAYTLYSLGTATR
jgi:hypothetical protein